MDSDHDILTRIEERTNTLIGIVPTLVTRAEFAPVKLIAFGMVGMLVMGVVGGILAMLIHK